MATFAEWQAKRQAGPTAEPDYTDKLASLLKDFAVENVAKPGLAVLGAAGDILSRPAYGVSEAYGEYAEGGGASDVLEGLVRGVSGGFEEAEHPTLGERIVPEQEGEGFGRKVARFGADVVTDPLILFGGPISKGVGKLGIAAGRFAKGSKLAKRFGETDIAQSMSRALLGGDYNVATFGGRSGKSAVGRARRGVEASRNMTAASHARVEAAMKALGVPKKSDEFWKGVTKALEGGTEVGELEGQMARVFRKEYDIWKENFSRFKDDVGDVFETFNPMTGEYAPFIPEANYSPRFLKGDIASKLTTKRAISEQTVKLAKQLKITHAQAERIIRYETGGIKRAGNIEYARAWATNENVFEGNALKNFIRYTDQVSNRYAMAQQFGVKGERLTKLMQGAEDAGLSSKSIETFTQGVNKRFEPTPLAGLAPAILGFQVLSKLGPTSVIAQFGQHVNVVAQQGVGRYVKGLLSISTDPAMAQRAAMTVRGGIQHQLEQLLGRAGAEGSGGRVSGLASKYLGAIGFKWADALPRRIAFAGAIPTAKNAVRKAAKWSDDLAELGVSKADFDIFKATGRFTEQVENKIGLRAAKLTQFEPDFLSLPPMWQSPEMRVVMQFRSFIHEQSRFLWQGVMKPAIKYLDTNGKAGSVKPLMRALVMYPVAGQGVAMARELMKEMSARALGAKRNKRYKRKFDYDHPIAQLAKDSLYVGAFGIAGDILEQAARGNLMGWIAGPTIGDVTGMVEGGFGQMMSGELPEMQDVAEFGARHVPGRRLFPLTPKELTTASTRRGLPGSFREWMEQRQ